MRRALLATRRALLTMRRADELRDLVSRESRQLSAELRKGTAAARGRRHGRSVPGLIWTDLAQSTQSAPPLYGDGARGGGEHPHRRPLVEGTPRGVGATRRAHGRRTRGLLLRGPAGAAAEREDQRAAEDHPSCHGRLALLHAAQRILRGIAHLVGVITR
eukprot:scaffold97130_cov36-Phaeocystis_antarctica.AAC.1